MAEAKTKTELLKAARTQVPELTPTELAKELQQFVRSQLAAYKRPQWVHFIRELPKTATGKIQRFRLRELAARQP